MTREELNEEIQKEMDAEEKKKRRKKTIQLYLKIILCVMVFSTIFYAYTTYVSTVKISVREYRITSSKIPSSFHGLKIIQISDLHFGTTMFQEEVEKVSKLSNDRKPDLIVFTGDLIDNDYPLSSEEKENLIKKLKNMKASLGKYAILGDEDDEEIGTIFNQSDFILLRNDYDLIYKNDNNPLLLVGLSSLKKEQDIEKAYHYFQEENHLENIFTITLLHEPDIVDNILKNYETDLFLAGHSQNGNIRLPIVHKALYKVENAKKYDQDYYEIENSKLYISSGLGTKKGIRLFCRPSINFFRLSNE